MEQCENLAMIISALGKNSSLKMLSIKLSTKALSKDEENIVFNEESTILCNALEEDLEKNQTLIQLEMINLRLKDSLIYYLGKGLRKNTQLKSLDISGNLLVNSLYIIDLEWTIKVPRVAC